MKIQKSFLFLILFSLSMLHVNAFLDFKFLSPKEKGVDFAFLTNVETKKKQLEELENNLNTLKKRYEDANKSISRSLKSIETDITEAKTKQKESPGTLLEHLNKKINLLNDRKQNLSKLEELWKNTVETVEKHIKLVQEIIDILQTPEYEELKFVYSWKEFKEAQSKLAEYTTQINTENTKKENFKNQKMAEKEALISLQKQVENKNKEREKLLAPTEEGTEKEDLTELKQKADILEQELSLLSEKIGYSNLKIEHLEQLIKLKESEIELLQNQHSAAKTILSKIEQRLVLDQADVEIAKSEAETENLKAIKAKEELNKIRDPKKTERDRLYTQLEELKEQAKQIKTDGDEVESYQIETKLQKIQNQVNTLDKELKIIDAKKEREDVLVELKEQQYQILDAYHKLNIEKGDLDTIISKLKNQKGLLLTALKVSKDKRNEEINNLIDANRNLDSLRSKEEEIQNKKETVFKTKNKLLNECLSNIADAKKSLHKQLSLTQDYLAVNSDLINNQEKIINQYEFVITDLEAKQVSISIWKRSPRAISWNGFAQSLADAENFFKKLFWETPFYVGPSAIVKSIQQLNWYDYLGLFFFILFFALTFIGMKKLLIFFKKRTKDKFKLYKDQSGHLYFNTIIDTLIEYILNHYKLIFSWFFFYLHVFFDFKYLFALIRPFTNQYLISLFYLVSIPILIYLSRHLISKTKALNQRLSFLFFAEKFQAKSIFLLTTILYSTSILIPLKQAFLAYYDAPSEFSNVILAAYSLILVVAILLFFGKDDVLTLLPSRNTFIIWLKEQIDKYYYPVFIFVMGLLILSNPYIGYYNLAWYLAFAVPSSLFLVYGMFLLHGYIRKYSISIFLREKDEEIIDKFEHAKTYYGFFIIAAFLALLFFAFILLARIWGIAYTPAMLWKDLSENWVLPIGPNSNFGIVQLTTLIGFIAIGFLVSSLLHKFVLNKLFDIFRTEPGTQNTIFRISHYIIISVTLILGFATVQLQQFIFWVGGLLVLGVGLGLKDMVTDFVAGFFVLIERPIEIGNFIQIDKDDPNTLGTVLKISTRATTLKTARNFSIVVPNKDLIAKPIINWGHGRLAVGFEVKILVAYKSDPELVKKIFKDTIQAHPSVLKVPAIAVRIDDFESDGIKFFSRAFISSRKVRDQWDIASDIRFALLKTLKENNITIPFPQHTIHFEKNNEEFPKVIDIKFDNGPTGESAE